MTREFVLFAVKQGWIRQNVSKQLTSICIWNPTMVKNVSFNEQEHHTLINNNVQEDGTPIVNKNKVDFTVGNNQLNDNNMNKVDIYIVLQNGFNFWTNNLGQNIWRLFHFLAQFFFTTSETELSYYH